MSSDPSCPDSATTTYGALHAELYDDLFRSRGKDFEQEAKSILALAAERIGDVNSLLDVACGTGAHLKTYANEVDRVVGIDSSAEMLRIARQRLSDVPLHVADMCTFDLEAQFDLVVSLGNSVACTRSPEELDAAIAQLAGHTAPGGVIVVEPWFFQHDFLDGHVGGHILTEAGRVVSRVTRSTRHGDFTHHQVQFTIADRGGINTVAEDLIVQLLPRERWELAFQRADCLTDFLPPLELAGRPNSPGLFVAQRRVAE